MAVAGKFAFFGGGVEGVSRIALASLVGLASAIPSASAVKLTVVAHSASEAGALVGRGAGSVVAALRGADGDGAIYACVSGEAGAAVVPIDSHHSDKVAGALVESALVAAVAVVDELAHRTVGPSEI